jgi:hypothetical protein
MLKRLFAIAACTASFTAGASVPAIAMSLAQPPDWLWSEIGPGGVSALSSWPGAGVGTSWQSCTNEPSGFNTCVPAGPIDAHGRLAMRPADFGHVIVATTTDGRTGAVVYRGPVAAGGLPSVAGDARVGARVRAIGGSWTGGFGTEASRLQLQVCRDRTDGDCLVIADDIYANRCASDGTTLPARYAGWYLRTVDIRTSQHQAYPMLGYPSPEAIPAAQAAPLASASVPLGPIAAGRDPAGGCQPRPLAEVRLLRRVQREPRRLVVGHVRCMRRCHTTTTVRRDKRSATLRTRGTFPEWTAVVLPPAAARRLGSGPLQISMTASDVALAERGTIRLPPRLLAPR